MIPELVTVHTSLLTDLGDAVRERFGVSGEMTIEEMTEIIIPKGPVPSIYQQVEYIASNGDVKLDTGIVINGQNYIRLAVMPNGQNNSSDWSTMLGKNENYKKACVTYSGANNRIYWEYGSQNTYGNSTTIVLGTKYKFEIDNTVLKIIKPDGTTLATLGSAQSFTDSANTFQVFGGNKGRIYDEIIIGTTESSIQYHGYPVYLKADPTQVGVYDAVSQTFNTGTGVGVFTAGPDIN